MRRLLITAVLCYGMSYRLMAQGIDLPAHLAQFSDFKKLDLRRLVAGEILSERGALMDFPNGISAQICFVVNTAPAETAHRLRTWNPSRYEALKVYAFQEIHTACVAADFATLTLNPKQRSLKWLADKTLATTASKSELNLTRDEAQTLAACARENSGALEIGACWARLLLNRATAFQRQGLAGALPYEVGGQAVSPAEQIHAMLLAEIALTHEFAPLLKPAGLLGGNSVTNQTPFYYWSLFDADHHGTVSLGARYLMPVGERYQLLDEEYYVSGNYYTSATLYEVWPLRIGDTTGSLVWRGDFFAAPMLAFTKGTERIAYGALMIQEIKKEVRCFQEATKVNH